MSDQVEFGLTLSNRGVALGITTVKDLLAQSVTAERSGAFGSNLGRGQSCRQAEARIHQLAVGGRRPDGAGEAGPSVLRELSPAPSNPDGLSMGQLRRPQRRSLHHGRLPGRARAGGRAIRGRMGSDGNGPGGAGAPHGRRHRDRAQAMGRRQREPSRSLLRVRQLHGRAEACATALSHLDREQSADLRSQREAPEPDRAPRRHRRRRMADDVRPRRGSSVPRGTGSRPRRPRSAVTSATCRAASTTTATSMRTRRRRSRSPRSISTPTTRRDFTEEQLRVWVAMGSPAQCIEAIRAHVDAGATIITLRFTARDPAGQLRRFIDEVYPAFARPAADRLPVGDGPRFAPASGPVPGLSRSTP